MARYLIGNVKGPKGDDGFSPSATVTQTQNGATITITDANGTTTANVSNGNNAYTAGENIQISANNVISATDTKYTAGANIIIDGNNVISATGGESGSSYIAGNGIAISGNVISNTVTAASSLTNDLGFITLSQMNGALADKQDVLTAGSGISITNNTISADNVSYSAGTGLYLDGTTFAADTTFLATKNDINGMQGALTAGDNITISNNVISAENTTYTAGTGITITNDVISSTITVPTAVSQLTNDANYVNQTQLNTGLATKQNTLTAGTGIEINNGVISATGGGGTTYTAGNGIGIDERDNNAIYVDSDVVAFKTMEDAHDGTQEYAATELDFGGVTAAWCDADGNYTKDAWMNNTEIGIETLTYNRDDSVWEPDRSISINPSDGITFTDEPAGITKSLNLNGREGTLEWDGSTVALTDDIPTYNAGDGILIQQQVATSSAGPLRSAVEPTNTYNVSLNLARDGGLAIDANGALYADIDLSDYATQRDLDSKQDALPTAPATNGTYFLTTTVSSGTATQAWVSIPAANGNSF